MNARVDRFDLRIDDGALDALIERRAVQIEIGTGSLLGDATKFENAANCIFLGTPQIRGILREFVDIARAHAELHMASDATYITQLYSREPWGTKHLPAICLTGLAGTGKSEILLALGRLLASSETMGVHGIRNIQLQALWLLKVTDGSGLNSILQPSSVRLIGSQRAAKRMLMRVARVSWVSTI